MTPWWACWRRRRRQPRVEELDEEIQAHLAMAVQDRIANGEPLEQARREALREFGNRTLVREATSEVWGQNLLGDIAQDVRYSLRGLRRSPGFTAAVVASLALGIGANTAIFSLLYTVMLRALPVAHPEQLVELLQKYPGEPRGNGYWSWRSYEYYRGHNHVFSALTGFAIDNRARVQVGDAEAAFKVAEYVTRNYFGELGLKPALGRLIGPDDVGPSEATVISWSLWTSKFNGDPQVVGRQILVDDKPGVVIGVAPRAFVGLRVEANTDLWMPKAPSGNLALLARLKPGVTLEQARAEMALLYRFTIEERLAGGGTDRKVRNLQVEIAPAGAGLATVRDRFGKPLMTLMAVVAVLLLLACVNIAGMLVARAAARSREMALRLGLGASRGRLVRQMLTESLILSAVGALAGAVVAFFATAALVRIMASGRPHERVLLRVEPDVNLLLFAVVIAILTGLLFGLVPALSAFGASPALALRQAGRSVETRFSRLAGRGLVAAQVALSMVLLSSAGLLVAHLAGLKSADLGFARDRVLLATLDPSRSGYRGERLSQAYRDLLDRLRKLPGVLSVSLSAPTPLHGAGAGGFATVDGFEEQLDERSRISISWVAPDYFKTMGTPLLQGREFAYQDQNVKPRPVIINQTVAQHYFAGRDPIGQRITMDHVTLTREPTTYEIIGVAGNANYLEIREADRRAIYLPAFRDGGVYAHTIVVRTAGEPENLADDVQRLARESGPGVQVTGVTTLADQIDATIVPERLMAALSGFFAALGALLAGIGLYGLLAYTVTRRTNEIGIRLALGATASRVARMVLREALATAVTGVLLGFPLAMWAGTLLSGVIEDLNARTATSLAIAAAALVSVALAASYAPAWRAARVDPVVSLRHE